MSFKPIDKVVVTVAVGVEAVTQNIASSRKLRLKNVHESTFWRYGTPIAIVGGGPSLKGQLEELRKFKHVMACGSVHDYLLQNDIIPTFTVAVDADEIMCSYMRELSPLTNYLIASQCSPKLFEQLKSMPRVYIWHAGGPVDENSKLFDSSDMIFGGGCTVGTRAIIIAQGMGYENIHLFGFDSCMSGVDHHAYSFRHTDKEHIGALTEVKLDGSDKVFHLADYHIAQLMDFKEILRLSAGKLRFKVHGDGIISELMSLGLKKSRNHTNG